MLSSPIELALQPASRAFRRLRLALAEQSLQRIDSSREQAITEMGGVRSPSRFLLMAQNQLRAIRSQDLQSQQLDDLECLAFGGHLLVEADGSIGVVLSTSHPIEGMVRQALQQVAGFIVPEICSQHDRVVALIRRQKTLLAAVYLLRDALALPAGDLMTLSNSEDPRIREWALSALENPDVRIAEY